MECFSEKAGIPLAGALNFFYHLDTYPFISQGVSDLHCMSSKYLADALLQVYQKNTAHLMITACETREVQDIPEHSRHKVAFAMNCFWCKGQEEICTMQTADTTPARAPEDAPALVKKIGKTTYKVRVHFSQTSTETMSDKIKRRPGTFKQVPVPCHAKRKGAAVIPLYPRFQEIVPQSCTLDAPYPG